MAWRETRATWRHFLYFFLCIAMGVGALVGVALFAANVERTISREARALLGGDVEIRLPRSVSEKGGAVLESLVARGMNMTHVSELVAMAATTTPNAGDVSHDARLPLTQLVELKAVEEGYPLYGSLQFNPDLPLPILLSPPVPKCARTPCYGALVQQSLLIRMGLGIGDLVKVGQAEFTITGQIRKEPDRVANMFSLGPRVIISREGLVATELVKPGSRVRERYLLRVPSIVSITALQHELRGRLAGESARVTTYRTAQPQLKRFLDQLTRYLGLTGLIALFVGGIGVAMSMQAFLREKLQTIAILKTLGAESAVIIRTYLLQALLLAAIGSLTGIALGILFQAALPALLAGLFASDLLEQLRLSTSLTASTIPVVLKGVAFGVLTSLLFALWPLLGVREIRPALIFRRDVTKPETASRAKRPAVLREWYRTLCSIDSFRWLTAGVIGLGLGSLAIWQAGSWKVGLLFLAALAVAVTGLLLSASLLVRALSRIQGPRSLAIRQAVSNLHRPGSQAVGIMLAVGTGVMVIVAVSLLERSLVRQVGESRPADAPTFFFIDIQPDQKSGFTQLIHAQTTDPNVQIIPLVRGRLHTLDGQPISDFTQNTEGTQPRERRKTWYFTRDYGLTFLEDLPEDNLITKGYWWDQGRQATVPLISIEEEAAKHLGLDLGSTVSFDIQGTTVSAQVSSIRKVDWGTMSTNFYMILSPGSLDGAPITYVATVRVPPEQEVPLQQTVVAAFPNVTAINIGEVLESFARILDRLSLAIQAVAVFCILAGSLVMAAALAATRYRRVYESVVFKALGATRHLIARSFAAEYALLGAAAGLIGVALASALSWAVLYFIFDLPWTLQPTVLAGGLVLTVAMSLAVGFLSTYRILGQRPLAVLRHE
ncbi:MAG: ABC transporter permease [Nitrospiraceae bacterium]